MKPRWSNAFLSRRYLVAIVAGLLLAGAFPTIGLAGLAWIAPGLMLAAALGKSGGEAIRIGYVAGLAHYLASLYWLLLIPYRWHGLPLGPAAGWLGLSAYLALYPAGWVWLVCEVRTSKFEVPEPVAGPHDLGGKPAFSWTDFGGLLSATWPGRTAWALAGAAAWVALEMAVARCLSGFPWNLLGASQYQMVPLIQIASVTGIYGVSFLVVWVSLSLLSAALLVIRRPTSRSVWIGELFLPLLVVALVFHFGLRRLREPEPAGRALNVTLLQPSIPQTVVWDSKQDEARFRDVIRLSEQALTNQTDLLIWPESAVPKLLRYDRDTFYAVTNLAGAHHVWMIIGADDAEPRRGSANPDDADYFNSSFLISPEGQLVKRYRKRNLVIFGEYIPFEHALPFLKWFTPIQGGFTPGDRAVPFELSGLGVRTSALICFEDIFPTLGREGADQDEDFLVNLTNNGWFGESAAQWQHAASGLFRAVENSLPLVRCSNNGVTGWMDGRGRVRRIFRDGRDTIYGAGFMTFRLPLPLPDQKPPATFYHRHGDWFGWSCVGIAGAMLARRIVQWQMRRRKL